MKEEFSCKAEIGETRFSRCSWLEMGILKGSVGLLSPRNEEKSIHKQLWRARDLVTLQEDTLETFPESCGALKETHVSKEARSSHSRKHRVVKVSALDRRDFRKTCKIA